MKNIVLLMGIVFSFVSCTFAEDAPLPKALWLTCQRNFPTALTVNWATDKPEPSVVCFGKTEACGLRTVLKGVRTLHHVEIPLPEKGPFFYKLEREGRLTKAVCYQGIADDKLRIAMIADWGFASADVSAILKDKPHMLVSGGDHISRLHNKGISGDVAKMNLMPHLKLLEKNPELFRSRPFMPVLGNHDREIRPRAPLSVLKAPVYDVKATAYLQLFPLPDDGWKWHFEIPAFGLRLVGLDLNHLSDMGTLLQTCHNFSSSSEQFVWYKKVMQKVPRPPFVITLFNAKSSAVRNLVQGDWGRMIRRGTLAATGFGYFGERAHDNQGFPWYNTSLNGKGDLYKDAGSKFHVRDDNYLLFTFKRGESQMKAEIKRLSDGASLDSRYWPPSQ